MRFFCYCCSCTDDVCLGMCVQIRGGERVQKKKDIYIDVSLRYMRFSFLFFSTFFSFLRLGVYVVTEHFYLNWIWQFLVKDVHVFQPWRRGNFFEIAPKSNMKLLSCVPVFSFLFFYSHFIQYCTFFGRFSRWIEKKMMPNCAYVLYTLKWNFLLALSLSLSSHCYCHLQEIFFRGRCAHVVLLCTVARSHQISYFFLLLLNFFRCENLFIQWIRWAVAMPSRENINFSKWS